MFDPKEVPQDWITITKSDTKELPSNFVGLYVGGTGDVTILNSKGQQVVFKAVPVGAQIPMRARLIMSTGTTATLMLGALGPGK